MSLSKIKKDDEIIVIAGSDKGRRGKVVRVTDGRVTVEGVNIVKKHVKPNPARGVQGGILEKEMPLDVSNVAIFNPTAKKADRVGVKILEDGKKVRYFKSNGEIID
jgi:large subunit ribosomal protein L24